MVWTRRQCLMTSSSMRKARFARAPHQKPTYLAAVRVNSTGSPWKGAFAVITLSRSGTCTFQSPASSASAHTSVAGSVGRHSNSRGPVGTPPIGTASTSGSEATLCNTAPVGLHTSTSDGKRPYVVK